MTNIILSLIVLIAFIETAHLLERRDLYNRLMSRTLSEFKTAKNGQKAAQSTRETPHEKLIREWRNGGKTAENTGRKSDN